MRKGIFPGSFDPLTYGHLDIIERSIKLCDKLLIAIAINSSKSALFTIDERIDIIKNCCNTEYENIEIVTFNGLLADYCKENNISFIVRGLRSFTDFEYESSISVVNRKLAPEVETIFLMANGEKSYISSNIVKEIASYNGDISSLVPSFVEKKITKKSS